MKDLRKNHLNIAMSNIDSAIGSATVLGSPIYLNDGRVVIPINKVMYGYGTGVSEYHPKPKKSDDLTYAFAEEIIPYGGELGAMNIKPEALLLIEKNSSRIIKIDEGTMFDKSFDLILEIVKSAIKKKDA